MSITTPLTQYITSTLFIMYTFIHQFQSISAIESAIRTFKTQWYFYFPTPARYRARAE